MAKKSKRRTKTNNRHILKCMRIENDVITYLNTHVDDNKSIAFYGMGGEGKSVMRNRLMPYFEEHGYTNFVSGEIPSCLGMDTRSTTRSNTWVVETCDDAIFSDERFMVFDFTE